MSLTGAVVVAAASYYDVTNLFIAKKRSTSVKASECIAKQTKRKDLRGLSKIASCKILLTSMMYSLILKYTRAGLKISMMDRMCIH